MKRINLLLYMLVGIFMLSACSKDETKVYLTDKPTSPTLSTPEDNLTIVLNKDDEDKAFKQFAWTPANYGFNAAIQYQVQFSKNSDMSRPKVLGAISLDNKLDVTNLKFDQFLLGILKLTPNVTSKVYFRVVAAVGGLPSSTFPAGGATTEIRTMTVTPFDTPIDVKSWGIVGSATPNGWNGPDFVMDDGDVANTFEAIVDLTVGEMKFRFGNNWDLNLGGTPSSLTQGGDNIKITEAGKYKFVLTIKKNGTTYTGTYTMTKL